MILADAIWEILNMRGQISPAQKLAEIRQVFRCEEYDLPSHLAVLRGEHSRRNKGCRSGKRRLGKLTWKVINRTRLR
jgi:hypothetical protein